MTEALKVMSMESLVATKRKNEALVTQLAEVIHVISLPRRFMLLISDSFI